MDNEFNIENVSTTFSVNIYTAPQKYNDTLSTARVRIFYKGGNRNSTFITEQFATQLINTLPYTPVKGIYDKEEGDYTDHGSARTEGRIYGIVPENPNFAWEQHLDEDGIERTYACADVLLFTAIYPEAKEIVNKSQSMELYAPTLKGEWKYINARKYFVFTSGSFLGLQTLGDNTEPCFEGAAFYNLEDLNEDLNQLLNELHDYNLGGKQMDKTIFKLSDDQKYSMIFDLINDKVDEDGYRVVTKTICAVYDDYAVCYDYVAKTYERVYYSKNDETDSVEITDSKQCFIVDVTEEEYNSLNALAQNHENTYANIDVDYAAAIEKVSECENSINELTQERDVLSENYNAAKASIETMTNDIESIRSEYESVSAEKEELLSFKKNVIEEKKLAVIASYENVLSAELIAEYTANIENYADEISLDRDMAYSLKQSNINVFTKQSAPAPKIPAAAPTKTGIEAILDKYKK